MSKENKTSDNQQNGNDFIADVSISCTPNSPINKHFKKYLEDRHGKYEELSNDMKDRFIDDMYLMRQAVNICISHLC